MNMMPLFFCFFIKNIKKNVIFFSLHTPFGCLVCCLVCTSSSGNKEPDPVFQTRYQLFGQDITASVIGMTKKKILFSCSHHFIIIYRLLPLYENSLLCYNWPSFTCYAHNTLSRLAASLQWSKTSCVLEQDWLFAV